MARSKAKYYVGTESNDPWKEVELEVEDTDDLSEKEGPKYTDAKKAEIPGHLVAYFSEPKEELDRKTRVIARRKQMFCGRKFHEDGSDTPLETFKVTQYFAGTISDAFRYDDENVLEYFVLFDNGHAEYVSVKNIRVIARKYRTENVPKSIRKFHKYYFDTRRTERRRLDCRLKDIIGVYRGKKVEEATVVEFYGKEMILVLFGELKCFEWIHRHSTRIETISDIVDKFTSNIDLGI